MVRLLAGIGSVVLLAAAGVAWWRAPAESASVVPPAPAYAGTITPMAAPPLEEPPQATEKTREEKRFARYDKDDDGAVSREEYLAARRKAYAKLDTDGDGRLSFEEYAVRTTSKFAAADADRSGVLNAAEFAKTRVVRKSTPRNCPPPAAEADS